MNPEVICFITKDRGGEILAKYKSIAVKYAHHDWCDADSVPPECSKEWSRCWNPSTILGYQSNSFTL